MIGNRHVGRLADGATPSTPTVAHAHRHCQSGTPLGLPIATAPCMKMDANSSTAHHHLAVSCARCLREGLRLTSTSARAPGTYSRSILALSGARGVPRFIALITVPLASSWKCASVTRRAQRWPTTAWSSCSRLVSVELVAAAAVGEAAMLVVLGCVPSGSCRSRAGTGGSDSCVFNLELSRTACCTRSVDTIVHSCNIAPGWPPRPFPRSEEVAHK